MVSVDKIVIVSREELPSLLKLDHFALVRTSRWILQADMGTTLITLFLLNSS